MKKSILFLLFVFSINCFGQINDGLVAFYSFCGNANDESNNNNNAAVFEATLTEDRLGSSERAYLFDGIDDFMEIENSQSLENLTSQMSISVWFNTTGYYYSGDNWAILLTKSGNSTSLDSRQFSLYYRDDGDIYFNNDIIGNFLFDLNQWYNLTITYDLGSVKTYVDGVLINDINEIDPVISNQLSLMIGYDAPGVPEYYNGILDEIRIYNRILSVSEVTQLTNDDLGCSIMNIGDLAPNSSNFIMYPNPSNDRIFISNNQNSEKILECYNIEGKLIFSEVFSELNKEFDISNLNSGLYILKLSSSTGTFHQKFVKE